MRRSYLKRGFAGLCAAACIIALIVLSILPAGANADDPPKHSAAVGAPVPAVSDMDTLTAIFTRRSIRKYTDRPVSHETVRILLQAAMSAPSARNEQSWEFVIVRDKDTLKKVPDISPFAAHVPGAQVAIVVLGNRKLEAVPGLWIPDCSNAAMNILLAAHSMGLGAVWTTLYPYEERMAGMKKLLGLPDHIVPLTIIPLGYPAEKKPGEDRFKPAKIHMERY